MKTKVNPPNPHERSFNAERFWRHYVAAVDSDDATWTEEQAKGGHAGRIFMFLLLFHVFLIASMVLFNLVAERPKPVFVDSTVPVKKAAPTVKKPAVAEKPQTSPVIMATKMEGTVEYVVTQGDSLKSIAGKTGATQEELVSLNHIDPNVPLAVGSKLEVPKSRTPVPVVTPVQPARVQEMTVAVQTAKNAGAAASFQAVQPESAKPPVKKAEPAVPPKPAVVMEKPPEDKAKAKMPVADTPPKPKTTEVKAVAKNEEPKKPAPPKTEEAPKPAPVKSTPAEKPAVAGVTHTVKPKETFYSISRKYRVSADELIRANGYTDPGRLREGASLKIPGKQ